jgi:hypothetical protein
MINQILKLFENNSFKIENHYWKTAEVYAAPAKTGKGKVLALMVLFMNLMP